MERKTKVRTRREETSARLGEVGCAEEGRHESPPPAFYPGSSPVAKPLKRPVEGPVSGETGRRGPQIAHGN